MQKATNKQLKEQNHDLVLKIFFESSPISRAEIARRTGLTRTTVSDIVTDLIHEGLVSEVGMGVSAGGRSPILVSLVDDSRYMIGLDLAYNQFRGAVVDLRGRIQQMISMPVRQTTGERAVQAAMHILDQLIKLPYRPLLGIGVATPGLVNTKEGIVNNAVNMEWQDVPLGPMLSQRYNLPVVVMNDCQAAAMGEFKFGGRSPVSRNMVVVRVGQGIGAGIIIDGKIFQGDGGSAGEIGHVAMQQQGGLACRCGKVGCLETLSSARAVQQRAASLPRPVRRAAGLPGAGSTNGDSAITLDQMIEAYQAGDPQAREIIEQAGYFLGVAISGVVSTLNINTIILMGEMTRFGQPWLEVVKSSMERASLTRLAHDTQILISALRENDVILGASALLAENYSQFSS